MKYCSNCGHPVIRMTPPGDHVERYVCLNCNTIHYENPKIIVGTIPIYEEKILLCKRAIDPQFGKWTIPAGFLELGETVEEGALRETLEEANARVEIIKLQAVYSIPKISQVYLLFLARLLDLDFHPGPETLITQLFSIDEIPWDEIAFTSVKYALKTYIEDKKKSRLDYTHLGIYPNHS
ncbi:MAG: NUDIX hydrolase [Leptospiraceae bacterium]|nr:NUDIX hydrolase [Leptospiraceae bacterium]MDW7976031.1 NUDIX hydrolase [Leptospiraceae bacterium]